MFLFGTPASISSSMYPSTHPNAVCRSFLDSHATGETTDSPGSIQKLNQEETTLVLGATKFTIYVCGSMATEIVGALGALTIQFSLTPSPKLFFIFAIMSLDIPSGGNGIPNP